MDDNRFDDLSRRLARGVSRRQALTGLAAGVAGMLGPFGAPAAGAPSAQANCGNVVCGSNPGRCKPGCVCCVYPNGNSRCRPPGTCAPGTETGTSPDPVDGGWTDWSSCHCPGGFETRECSNPEPQNGGKDCDGPSTRPCDCVTTTTTPAP